MRWRIWWIASGSFRTPLAASTWWRSWIPWSACGGGTGSRRGKPPPARAAAAAAALAGSGRRRSRSCPAWRRSWRPRWGSWTSRAGTTCPCRVLTRTSRRDGGWGSVDRGSGPRLEGLDCVLRVAGEYVLFSVHYAAVAVGEVWGVMQGRRHGWSGVAVGCGVGLDWGWIWLSWAGVGRRHGFLRPGLRMRA